MYTLQAQEFFRSPADTVAVEQRTPQDPFPEHDHEFSEIAIVSQGGGVHVVNDRLTRVCAGSVLYLRPNDCHAFTEVQDLYLTNVIYRLPSSSPALLAAQNAYAANTADWQIGSQTRQQVMPILAQLAADFSAPAPVLACYREGLFLQLMALLWQARYCPQPERNNEENARQLINFVRGNFTEPMDWLELAAQFSLAPRTLHRKVKEQTGMTPQRYLNSLRLDYAAGQLRHTTTSITDIAFASGFDDSNYFSTLFRQEFGCSPREYRLQGH